MKNTIKKNTNNKDYHNNDYNGDDNDVSVVNHDDTDDDNS